MRRSQREGRFDPHPQARRRPQRRGRPSRVGLPPMFATPFLALRSLTHSPRSLFTLASLRVRVRVWRVTLFSSSSSHSFTQRRRQKEIQPTSTNGPHVRSNGVNGTFKCKCCATGRCVQHINVLERQRTGAQRVNQPNQPTLTVAFGRTQRRRPSGLTLRAPNAHPAAMQRRRNFQRRAGGRGTARHGTTRRGHAATIATASLPCPARTRRRVGGPAGPAGGSGPAATRVTRDAVRGGECDRGAERARGLAGWKKKTNAFLRRRGRGEGDGDGWPHLPRVFLSCLPRRRQRASERAQARQPDPRGDLDIAYVYSGKGTSWSPTPHLLLGGLLCCAVPAASCQPGCWCTPASTSSIRCMNRYRESVNNCG